MFPQEEDIILKNLLDIFICISVLTVYIYVLHVYAWCLRSQKSFRSLRHGDTSACKFVIK